jgi:tetratricopeptide (TPR) repeat protein
LRAVALALCALLGACAGQVRVAQLGLPAGHVELDATPFFPQAVNECGPAALATVLAASGVAVTPDELAPTLYLPGRQGSLQAEVIASARRHGRVPYPLRPRLEELLATVASGTPVLVLQNLRIRSWPAWHYAVVVGYDAGDDSVVLRSGTERRRVMSLRAFERSWSLADRWALAVVAPDAPPQRAEPLPWLRAASAFEELGQPDFAGRAYLAATRRWPAEPLGWQVLANLRYARKDLAGAEDALRQAHALAPSVETLNNLAQVLLERGCPRGARAALERADALEAGAAEREVLARTRAELDAYRGQGPCHSERSEESLK